MIEVVREKITALLESGAVAGFLGLKLEHGQVGPHLFQSAAELRRLSLGDRERPGDSRYPLVKLLAGLARARPEEVFGVLLRGCDERGLRVLFSLNQLDPAKVVGVGIACPPELAESCECAQPYPDELTAGEKTGGVPAGSVDALEALGRSERLSRFMADFARCLRCYGCVEVCPVCLCRDCSLRCRELVGIGEMPPAAPLFHLIRAVDTAGRCVDCGLCAEACPAGLPLRTLYKKVARIMEEEFGFRAGWEPGRTSPLLCWDTEPGGR
ncbi:MAG: 4Fe-4S binding protein [Thermodesulfobacteriota bacterium]